MDISIIIPCYNEADNVPKIQEELLPVVTELAKRQTVEVIFIDDGSADNTWKAFTEAFSTLEIPQVTLRFEKHEVNKGLGAAIRTGFAAAKGDIVITTDSDGTYKFEEIPNMLQHLTGGADIVTASPYHPDGGVAGVPRYRLILSQGSSILYRILVAWRIHTYTALFRAYRREVIEDIPFNADGYLAGTEFMVKAMFKGYKVAEYPTVLHSRVFGVSKAKIVRTIKAHLAFQGRVLLHKLHISSFFEPAVPVKEIVISSNS